MDEQASTDQRIYSVAIVVISVFLVAIGWLTYRLSVPDTFAGDDPTHPDKQLGRKNKVRVDWKTDWSKISIDPHEIMSGGVARDAIPPIYKPTFTDTKKAGVWIHDDEPVMVISIAGQTRIYPISILMFHEIVSDQIGNTYIAVTFCPLCNAAIVFNRSVDGKVYTFGVSGMLRKSDMLMWDHETESLWQQLTGTAVVGSMLGKTLRVVPSKMIGFQDAVAAFPEAKVLSKATGHQRQYGMNPYRGYDLSKRPFLFRGKINSDYPAMERMLCFVSGDGVAYSYSRLLKENVVHDTVSGERIVIFYEPKTKSALHEGNISQSRAVGSAAAYSSVVDGRQLTFTFIDDGIFKDTKTGSFWTVNGICVSGEFKGKRLRLIKHAHHFWFAWQAFYPDTEVRDEN
jgi:hypothetical protein